MLSALIAATIAAGVILWVELLRQLAHSRHIGPLLRFLCAILAGVVAILGLAALVGFAAAYFSRLRV